MSKQNLAGIFTAALMKGNPSIDKKRAADVWNKVSNSVDVTQVSKEQLAQMAYQIAQKSKPGFADGGVVDEKKLSDEPVVVTGRRPPPIPDPIQLPNVNVPSDYLTPEQAKMQSDILTQNQQGLTKGNPFDPDALKEAYAKYQDYLDRNAMGRGVSGYLAGSVAGSSQGRSVEQDEKDWEQRDKNAKFMTVDMQKALMDQYKSGLDANKQLLDNLKTNAQFKIDASKSKLEQTKTQAELVPILQNANTRMSWANPDSAQSKIAQDVANQTLKALGFDDKFINTHIAGKSAVEISMTLSGIVPNSMDLIKKSAETGKIGAEIDKMREETRGVSSDSDVKRAQAKTSITPEGTIKDEPGVVITSTIGGITRTNPGKQAESTAAAEDRTKTAQQLKNYETIVKPAIQDTLDLLKTKYTGKGAKAIASIIPGNDQAMVANALMSVYSAYPEALPAAVGNNIKAQMGKQGWTGIPTIDLRPEQIEIMLKQAMANIERIKNYRSKQTEFENKGGKPTEFYKEPEASVSSSTGSVTMIKNGKTYDIPASDVAEAESLGYKRK